MKFRNGFEDELAEEVSFDTGIEFEPDEDKTVQSGKDDADINVILRRFAVTGNMPAPRLEPFYGDFSEVQDYQTALNSVMEAQAAFMSLSAEVRNRFENDPAKLIAFLDDPDNYEEAGKLCLLKPKDPEPGPMKVEVVNSAPAASTAAPGAATSAP